MHHENGEKDEHSTSQAQWERHPDNASSSPELHVEKRGNDEYVIVDPDVSVHSKVLSYLSLFVARQQAKNAVAFLPTITLSPNMKVLLVQQTHLEAPVRVSDSTDVRIG